LSRGSLGCREGCLIRPIVVNRGVGMDTIRECPKVMGM
jgi:hypothetical protein